MKTLKSIFLLLSLIITGSTVAQQKLSFTYDNSGNRTKREIVFKKHSEAIADSTLPILPVTEWMDEMKIAIYPNPTKGLLSVNISNMPDDIAGELAIYTLEGKLLQYSKVKNTDNKLDISDYPLGVYILRILLDKKSIEWRIVKE